MPRFIHILVLFVAGAALRAQQPVAVKATPDPAFSLSRYDELWPAAKAPTPWRALKHIALRSDDAAWLTLGGAVRGRASSFDNFNLSNASANQDSYSELRTTLHADLWLGRATQPHARAFVEVRDANGVGRTLPGGIRTNERDRTDWQNVFVEVGNRIGGMRYGRQELALGRERLVGVSDWANARRSFEGVKGMGKWANLRGEVFNGRVVAMRSTLADRPDSTTQFRYAAVATVRDRAPARSVVPALWQAWAMRLQSDRGASSRTTVGARAVWRAPVESALLALELEGATQRGHLKTKSVDAWFYVAEGTLTWKGVKWAPSALVGLDVGSGTGADSLHTYNAFQPPYATAHAGNGIADVLGRGNLVEARWGGTVDPSKTVQVQGLWRHYWRLRTEDGVYTKTNTLFRAASGSTERPVMHEADVIINWQQSRHLKFQGGAAYVMPGPFLKRGAAGASPERFAYLSTSLTF